MNTNEVVATIGVILIFLIILKLGQDATSGYRKLKEDGLIKE
jgi:hypothetical protein